jgi:hypothetical protein
MEEQATEQVAADWRESLPETVREWKEVQDSDAPEKFWSQVENMRSYVGQSLRVPGPDAPEDDWNKFYTKVNERAGNRLMAKPDPTDQASLDAVYNALGRPEAADAYELGELPMELEPDRVQMLKQSAHAAGLTNKQFQTLLAQVTEVDAAAMQAQETKIKESVNAVRQEWGQAFDHKMDTIQRTLTHTGAPQQVIDAIQAGGVDGATLRWFDKLAKSLGGESINADNRDTPAGLPTALEARAQADEIMRKMQNMAPGDPDYQRLAEKRLKLIELSL